MIAIDTNIILRFLTRQPKAQFEVSAAIRIARQGMPFKDAFVLAFSAEADQLVTFDRAFVKRAARLQLKPKVDFP